MAVIGSAEAFTKIFREVAEKHKDQFSVKISDYNVIEVHQRRYESLFGKRKIFSTARKDITEI